MAQADSNTVTAFLTLQGVWLHDPTDPAGTAAQYLHGGTGRTDSPALDSTELQFVGRTLPVFEFGEARAEQIRTTVQVPHGADWATQVAALETVAASRRVWCYRDNRGRKAFGQILIQETDQQWGTQVDVTVNRADFTEAV
ncbi:MAG TPA: hypothetical protein VIS06_04405 [Mycobacteriales bacterium]